MSESPSHLKTGLAVFMGVVLLLASILFFGADRSIFKSYNRYSIRFQSTQGLNVGSVVSLAGMEVGNIEDIQFDANSLLVAHVKVEKRFSHIITDQTLASIKTQGALGDKYIYLSPSDKAGTPLNENAEIQVDRQPDLLDMISGKASEFSIFKDILTELSTLLKNLNTNGNSAHLMENVVETSQSMTKLLKEPNVYASFNHLKSILKKIDDGQGTLGQLVNDPTLHQKLAKLLGESPSNNYLKPLLREAIKQNEKQR